MSRQNLLYIEKEGLPYFHTKVDDDLRRDLCTRAEFPWTPGSCKGMCPCFLSIVLNRLMNALRFSVFLRKSAMGVDIFLIFYLRDLVMQTYVRPTTIYIYNKNDDAPVYRLINYFFFKTSMLQVAT
jgi:hypothetical protein